MQANSLASFYIIGLFNLSSWLAADGGATDFSVAGVLQTGNTEILCDVTIEKNLLA